MHTKKFQFYLLRACRCARFAARATVVLRRLHNRSSPSSLSATGVALGGTRALNSQRSHFIHTVVGRPTSALVVLRYHHRLTGRDACDVVKRAIEGRIKQHNRALIPFLS